MTEPREPDSAPDVTDDEVIDTPAETVTVSGDNLTVTETPEDDASSPDHGEED
jgi:hypothetical protein